MKYFVFPLLLSLNLWTITAYASAQGQSNLSPSTTKNQNGTVGVCQVIPNPTVVPEQVGYDLAAWSMAQTYLKKYKNINTVPEDVTEVTVLQHPKHGKLIDIEVYDPEPGYFGKDSVTYLVEIAGYRIKVTHFIQVDTNTSDETYRKYCPKGEIWKISLGADDTLHFSDSPFTPYSSL